MLSQHTNHVSSRYPRGIVKATSMSKKAVVSCGRDLTCVPDLAAALDSAGKLG